MKNLIPCPMTAAPRTLPRTVRAHPDLARRCRRAERIAFAAVALAMLVFAGSGVQPGNVHFHAVPIPTHETPSAGQFGWPI